MSRPSVKVHLPPPVTAPTLSSIARGELPESEYSHQLRRGFKTLKFIDTLEEEFRRSHSRDMRQHVRASLWLACVFVVTFSLVDSMVSAASADPWLNIVRYAVFLPVMLIALTVAYTSFYERFYSRACQIGVPLFGAGVVLLEVLAEREGTNVISTLVITTVYGYLMLGMLFYGALRTGLAVLALYAVAAGVIGVSGHVFASNLVILVFTNVIGAAVCYTLEKANRTNYLEARLLIEVASRDGLTGIFNRRTFDEHIEKMWQQAARERTPVALLLIDIDHFKPYNDSCGHVAGDDCLRRVARCLERAARRPLDLVARYGGEEFAILLYDARRPHAEEIARRLQVEVQSLNIRHPASSAGPRLTVSIGAASVEPKLGRSHVGFIQLADEALYEAKAQGRNRVVMMDKEYELLTTGTFRKPVEASDPAA